MMKANKQIGFIYKDNESIDKILKDGDVVFERGFLRERTSTTLPITFGGVGKDLKDYIVYGNTVQNGTPTPVTPIDIVSCGDKTSNLFSSKMELGTINDSGQNANSENAIRTKDYIEVNPNTTYTMSNDKNYRIFLYQYDENNDYVTHSNNYGGYITFTTASNTKYVKARTNAGTIENDLTSLWKLAEGSTVTPYEPYGYKIPVNVKSVITNIYLDEPLRKIDEYSDYIDFINGKVVRNIKEIVLNGTETGAKAAKTSTYYTFAITAYGSITNKNSAINCLSNMFLPSATSIINTFRIATTSGNLAFTVPLDFVSSYDYNSFKAKLQELYNNGTPVVIIIPLATPTEEDIELPSIPTVEGNNTLNIETEITPSQVYIKYKSNT